MEKTVVDKKHFFWNMVGSVCYSGSSFYYLMIVTRICGVEEAGIYSLAFATAQLLLTIGRFGIRTYQATDVRRQYQFEEYGLSRVITCVAMIVGAVLYVVIMRFHSRKAWMCVWVAAFKMTDAIEDVFHGELQRRFRVDLMGKLLAFRNLLSCAVFTGALVITKDILVTCAISAVGSILICCLANGLALLRVGSERCVHQKSQVFELLKICAPIFVSTFLSLYLYNVPKYAIDAYLETEIQTYYGILFMPSFVITLFSEIITKPLMTTMTIEWDEDLPGFCAHVWKICGLIVCGTVGIVLGGHFIGRYLLELIYGVELSPFKIEFIVLLAGGGASASAYVLYNLLIAIRHEKCIIVTYGVMACFMTGIIFVLVKQFGMLGASIGYLLSCIGLCLVFATILVVIVREKQKEKAFCTRY